MLQIQRLVKRIDPAFSIPFQEGQEEQKTEYDILLQLLEIEHISFPKPLGMTFFQEALTQKEIFLDVLIENSIDKEKTNSWVRSYCYYQKLLDEMHIIQMATHPRYRRQGHSKYLLQHAIQTAQHEGCNVFWLEVRESNLAALCLYQSFGFSKVGKRSRYYSDDGEDAWVMKKDLNF